MPRNVITSPAVRIVEALEHDLGAHGLPVKLSLEGAPATSLSELRDLMGSAESGLSAGVYVEGQLVAELALASDVPAGQIGGALVLAADQLQDHVADSLRIAWPKCLQHDHPLRPVAIEGQAVWICPATSQVQAAIGELVDSETPHAT
jgi:hypothetical protein